MLRDHLEICLFQPEIPQNTGSTGRLVAATGCRLHLVKPFGFASDDKQMRRAGLDYWPYLDLEIHDSIFGVTQRFGNDIAFMSANCERPYVEIPKDVRLIVFGQESRGLPDYLWESYPQNFYTIPMYHSSVRSLNLATSVAIVLYHQLLKRKELSFDPSPRN